MIVPESVPRTGSLALPSTLRGSRLAFRPTHRYIVRMHRDRQVSYGCDLNSIDWMDRASLLLTLRELSNEVCEHQDGEREVM